MLAFAVDNYGWVCLALTELQAKSSQLAKQPPAQSNIELMTGNVDLAAKRLLLNWHRKYCTADDIVDVTTRLLGPGERVGQMCAVIETLKGGRVREGIRPRWAGAWCLVANDGLGWHRGSQCSQHSSCGMTRHCHAGDGFEWPPAIYAELLGHACDTPDLAALQRCTETMRELGVLTAPLAFRCVQRCGAPAPLFVGTTVFCKSI
jgi:hypothetical protein